MLGAVIFFFWGGGVQKICFSLLKIESKLCFLLSLTSKGDILEDPAMEPSKDMFMMSVDPEDAPDTPE